jgi:hypothetical protein
VYFFRTGWSTIFTTLAFMSEYAYGKELSFQLMFYIAVGFFVGHGWSFYYGKKYGPAWKVLLAVGAQLVAMVGFPLFTVVFADSPSRRSGVSIVTAALMGVFLGFGHSIYMSTAVGVASLVSKGALSTYNTGSSVCGLTYIALLPLIRLFIPGDMTTQVDDVERCVSLYVIFFLLQVVNAYLLVRVTLGRPPFVEAGDQGPEVHSKRVRNKLRWPAWAKSEHLKDIYPQLVRMEKKMEKVFSDHTPRVIKNVILSLSPMVSLRGKPKEMMVGGGEDGKKAK